MAGIESEERSIKVLMADDDDVDIQLIREAFRQIDAPIDFTVVRDGTEVLSVLQSVKSSEAKARPKAVMLDLKMPRKSGLDVLKEMKQDPALAAIPVIILSNSSHEEDVARCYAASAQAYIPKPQRFEDMVGLARTLSNLWTRYARLP